MVALKVVLRDFIFVDNTTLLCWMLSLGLIAIHSHAETSER